jgi:MFS family permease
MSLSILCYSLCTGVTYFVQTPEQLTLARFCAALGMGGEWALGVALVMEIWPNRFRPMLAGVIGAAGNLGFVLIGIIGLAVDVTQDSWRWITLVGCRPGPSDAGDHAVCSGVTSLGGCKRSGPLRPCEEACSPPSWQSTAFWLPSSAGSCS